MNIKKNKINRYHSSKNEQAMEKAISIEFANSYKKVKKK